MLKNFKEFAMKGNVIDLAVGIVLGVAFGGIINSLVADIIMPPIGLFLGNVDFSNLFLVLSEGATSGPYASIDVARETGAVTLNYGLFINTLVNFLIVAFAMFLLITGVSRTAKENAKSEPSTKDCPHCFSSVSIKATRCAFCTSNI
jgi:large conductance mechanosensitive channel